MQLDKIKTNATAFALVAISLVSLGSCGNSSEQQTAEPPPAAYPVLTITPQKAELYADFPANIQGQEDIELRPKIDGYIDKIFIDEGSTVKKGQLLFTILNPQYEQAVRNAQAAVISAEAQLNTAQLQVDKTRPLVERDIISHFELESAENALKTQKAAVAQAKASLSTAQSDLDYTRITSPVNGVVGVIPYKVGSYVSSATTQPLTTVANTSRVYAYFAINEKQQLTYLRNSPGKNLQERLANIPAVQLILADGSIYEETGKIETISGIISSETGSVNARAGFDNPTGLLSSGNSAVVRIPSTIDTALLIPQRATYEVQGKRFVYVLQQDQTVAEVEVIVNPSASGTNFVVEQGLRAGDKIVSDGVANLISGAKIQAEADTVNHK